MGDTLFTLPALCALKNHFQDAKISCILGRTSAPLLENHPCVDERIILPANAFKEKLKIFSELKSKHFDAAVLFQHTLLNALYAKMLGVPVRAGLNWKGCGGLLTHKIPCDAGWHEAERYLKIAELLGAQGERKYELHVTLQEREEAKNMLKAVNIEQDDFIAGMFPGTSGKWKIKRWSEERFAALADKMNETAGAKIIVFGGAEDEKCVRNVVSKMSTPAVNLCGKTTLRQLAALSALCRVVISNDTGPMHLAAACGANVIDICGQSNPGKTGPLSDKAVVVRKDIPCSPCRRLECDHRSCLELITVDEVLETVRKVSGLK